MGLLGLDISRVTETFELRSALVVVTPSFSTGETWGPEKRGVQVYLWVLSAWVPGFIFARLKMFPLG